MAQDLVETNKQIEVSEINGRTRIVFKKALIKGKVNQNEVLETLLIAAKMQGEYFIQKLSRGSPLDKDEVKSLKELAEIAKLQISESNTTNVAVIDTPSLKELSSKLYEKLAEKS